MNVTLRDGTPEDATAVSRVLRSSRQRHLPYAPSPHTEDQQSRWVAEVLLPAGGVTVAALEDRVIGVLATRTVQPGGWIDQLYIEPGYCGLGIGSRLLEVGLTRLQRPVWLYTFQQNSGARRFYERRGFSAVAFSDGASNEERCPDVLYELR